MPSAIANSQSEAVTMNWVHGLIVLIIVIAVLLSKKYLDRQ
jgi:hypothetical protein